MQVNKDVEKTFFTDLKFGDAFKFRGNDYIKIKDVRNVAAALCLDTWRVYYPCSDCVVFPYDNDASSIELKGV